MYEWRMNGVLYVVLYVYNEYLGKCVHGKGGRGPIRNVCVCHACLCCMCEVHVSSTYICNAM